MKPVIYLKLFGSPCRSNLEGCPTLPNATKRHARLERYVAGNVLPTGLSSVHPPHYTLDKNILYKFSMHQCNKNMTYVNHINYTI